MPSFTDQTGRTITVPAIPRRIISIVPSQTELLFDLGLNDQIVGITKFCIHPAEWFHTKTRIGGTKQVKMETIHQLQPDLIIANKEENVKEQIEELAAQYPIWVSDVNNLADAYEIIEQIGLITDTQQAASEMISAIKKGFAQLPSHPNRPKALYLIWENPYMTVGGDTFIHAMLEAAGFQNCYAGQKRYPEISVAEIKNQQPDILLLSSEPFPFQQKHIMDLQKELPDTKILLVDGEMFSWYGSRLIKAPKYFQKLQQQIQEPAYRTGRHG
jgi:ABC-type Fe3+-hydroxamate transport system substrate-binding protein